MEGSRKLKIENSIIFFLNLPQKYPFLCLDGKSCPESEVCLDEDGDFLPLDECAYSQETCADGFFRKMYGSNKWEGPRGVNGKEGFFVNIINS